MHDYMTSLLASLPLRSALASDESVQRDNSDTPAALEAIAAECTAVVRSALTAVVQGIEQMVQTGVWRSTLMLYCCLHTVHIT
jgi:hypothetical protein